MEPAAPLISFDFLRRVWAHEYAAFRDSPEEATLIQALQDWANRSKKKETTDESGFLQAFFVNIWGYQLSGSSAERSYTLHPKKEIKGAGVGGYTGQADAALGWFDHASIPPVPMVVCEFKDIRADLDTPQKRKNDKRSPVKQCAEYLREASRPFYGHEKFHPLWGFVSNMNEFRLYWRNTMPSQCQRFIIEPTSLFESEPALLGSDDKSRFRRFVFRRLFHADMLLTRPDGQTPLLRLIKEQGQVEREIEKEFYGEYREYRLHLYQELLTSNPGWTGTRSALVRVAQKILDRCIFVMFCEDMGRQLSFPPNLLTDFLKEYSQSSYYDPNGIEIWEKLKTLFNALNTGGSFAQESLNRFNGGLFRTDPILDGLKLTNQVFCKHLQAESEEALSKDKNTLLYFTAFYNFGIKAGGERSISLYTLGRIFEQSITELEQLEAEADERPSLTVLSKRKTDGVYYTPEWVVAKIVDETVGQRLNEARVAIGWDEAEPIPQADNKRKQLQAKLEQYLTALGDIKIVDPACGSGAFLIHALEYLLAERKRVKGLLRQLDPMHDNDKIDEEAEIRFILASNIYGVDINPASVEIARLALWLHTARADRPLCDLDANIVEGNSLVGTDFYGNRRGSDLFDAEERDLINAFDWQKTFKPIMERGGFDCVIGNPPYVKLQNMKKVMPEVVHWLKKASKDSGQPLYESTQFGNYDLYLPFIERGLALLRPDGCMGYIAPSLWLKNEYGKGLRQAVKQGRNLDRWIDFRDYQIFDEAITYTALQFFDKNPSPQIRFAFAPDGQTGGIDWAHPDGMANWDSLPDKDAWIFAPAAEKALLDRLAQECDRLDSPNLTNNIFQGLITSANPIYHLRNLGANLYQTNDGAEITIENAIMRPLVSGEEAKRYIKPQTETWILFPYQIGESGNAILLSPEEMQASFPLAWGYLRQHESNLRRRENSAFDDTEWYRFGRNQNLDKQHLPKLCVAQTVPNLRICCDSDGSFSLDNVRVNGIIPLRQEDTYFLLGVLNGKVADWCFRRIAKPKEDGYFEANKQFIAPLPIPRVDAAQKAAIGAMAQELESLHTELVRLKRELARRFSTCGTVKRDEDFLWPELSAFKGREKAVQRKARLAELIDALGEDLAHSDAISAIYENGELKLMANKTPVLDHIFVSADEGRILANYWVHLLATTPSLRTNAKKLAAKLCHIPQTDNKALRDQISELDAQTAQLRQRIEQAENAMNDQLFALYRLTEAERVMVMAG